MWVSQNFNTYIVLKPGVDAKSLEKRFNVALEKYAEPEFKSAVNLSMAELEKGGGYFHCSLMPLTKIHLYSNKPGELGANGNIQDLIAQFLTESLLISFLSLIVALLILWLLIPYFNRLSQKDTGIGIFFKPRSLFFMLSLVFVVGLLAGCYPAFFLSAFKPIEVLNKEQVLVIQHTDVLRDQLAPFRNALFRLPGVQNVTVTGFLPVDGYRSNDVFFNDA
jgi:putative ABC transport system permease protein